MAYQFGIGVLYGGAVGSEMEFGCIQGVTLDFSFEKAMLHCGNSLYPRDVRVHSASITGKAQFADIDGEAVAKLLVSSSEYTPGDTSIAITDASKPDAFRIRFTTTTDGVGLVFTLNACQSDSISWSFSRSDYVIPDFGFTAYADENGNVATIDLGDAS